MQREEPKNYIGLKMDKKKRKKRAVIGLEIGHWSLFGHWTLDIQIRVRLLSQYVNKTEQHDNAISRASYATATFMAK